MPSAARSTETAVVSRGRLLSDLDEVLTRNARLFVESVPYASHLNDETPLDAEYYIRHRIETIKRIRCTARTDALALAAMVEECYDAARLWAGYAAEELTHDALFAEDLAAHGVGAEQIDSQPLFVSTRELDAYLSERIAVLGSLPAVAYSLLVEWNSERYSGPAIEKARRTFGDRFVARSAEHYEIDQSESHYELMVDIAHAVLEARRLQPEVLYELIDDIAALLRAYFGELSAATVGGRADAAR